MERLKDYVKRFNQAILEVDNPSDKVVIMAMMEGLRPGPLFDSLSKNVPETLSALQNKADKYIAAEELAEAKRRRRGKDDPKRKEPDSRRPDYKNEARNKRSNRDLKSIERCPHTPPCCLRLILPPLNAPIAQVLMEIKHEEFVTWPGKIKTDPTRRNRNKYCEFHRDHGHNTEDCFQLKEQIVDLIKKGFLRKYVANRQPPEQIYGDNRPTARDIQVIHGGFGSGGCASSSRQKTCQKSSRQGRGGSLQPILANRRGSPANHLRQRQFERFALTPRRCPGNHCHHRQLQRPKNPSGQREFSGHLVHLSF
ncbi:uncharacterized protein LOC130789750 [Actinidia eriantha]|uniref:uncharacterized protein LOC130789750 n=1 Tax=Actinidia eriantha TaxID=165200 RepID=UPI002586C588|nr:uncharacterized protein LOC130789750 [Actinidia eriantha]